MYMETERIEVDPFQGHSWVTDDAGKWVGKKGQSTVTTQHYIPEGFHLPLTLLMQVKKALGKGKIKSKMSKNME
jgi:hypothetical protein